MLFKRNLSIVVIATLLLTFISTGIATPALGKSSRVAVITDLTGSATVKSSGGSREYDAYIDMGLAQGDYITTDAKSSVKFKIKDHEDEVTIGANSVIALITLTDKGKGKKSKIKVLSGSVWSNVKKLAGGDDFEVETPTAVMAVRGTKVLTSVDSESGETYVAVAAGTVSAKTNNEESPDPSKNDEILIAPSQQLSLDSREEVSDLETKVGIIDPKDLVGGTSSEIIEAIVKDKADIDRENAEFIAAQKEKLDKGDPTGISRGGADSSLNPKDQSELDKIAKNLDNLIGNVVNTALEEKKVDKDKIDKIIEDINKDITDPNKKLDLSKVEPLDKTAGVDPALQKAKDAELKKLADAKKAADDAKKAAEAAAKLKLAEALKKLEEEKARIAKEKEALGLNKATPTPKPATIVIPVVVPNTNTGGGGSTPAPTLASPIPIAVSNDSSFNLRLGLNNVTVASQVYGVEVHVVYNNEAGFNLTGGTGTILSDFFDSGSVTRFDHNPIVGATQKEIIYAAVLPKTGTIDITSNMNLVTLPFVFNGNASGTIDIYVTVVRKIANADGSFITIKTPISTPVHATLNYYNGPA